MPEHSGEDVHSSDASTDEDGTKGWGDVIGHGTEVMGRGKRGGEGTNLTLIELVDIYVV